MEDLPQRLDFESARDRVLVVEASEDGLRLDRFLAGRLGELTRASVQRIVRRGGVRRGGEEESRPAARVREGERVEVRVPEIVPVVAEPQDLPLAVLREERAFAVLDKAPGMAVHPGRGRPDGTLANALAHRYGALPGGDVRPGIVHRLDLETSGVMVVALNESSHAALARAFKERRVRKEYRALVHGEPQLDRDRIDRPIGRDPRSPGRMAIRVDRGRDAVTDLEVLERFGPAAHLLCRPLTGRTHQIRVHLRGAGHPILGDRIYASRRRSPVPVPRLMLHAHRLVFPHPETGETVEAQAPIPADFADALVLLRGLAG